MDDGEKTPKTKFPPNQMLYAQICDFQENQPGVQIKKRFQQKSKDDETGRHKEENKPSVSTK